MSTEHSNQLADLMAKDIANKRVPFRVEMKTDYRCMVFEAIPSGKQLRIICTTTLVGNLPDNDDVSRFLTSCVNIICRAVEKTDYAQIVFEVPHMGERVIVENAPGNAGMRREKMSGGISCN